MEKSNYKIGLLYAASSGLVWGFLPIYWNLLNPISSMVIIFYRIVLMFLLCLGMMLLQKRSLKAVFAPMFADRKSMCIYILAGIIIISNWSIYVWAVTGGYVIQASMGYFIEPLIVSLLAMIIYKEKANKWKWIALVLGAVGLVVQVIGYKEIPLISLGIAVTFAVYAAIKKSVKLSSLQSLLYETLFLAPIALCVIACLETSGTGALAAGGAGKFMLLLFSGIASAIPLALFANAAPRLPLLTLGLTQYISPSISLLLGIFLFKESFNAIQFSSFVIVWIGLVFFTYGEYKEMKQMKREHKCP